jgi:type IV secretion system protein VirB4
MVSPRGNRLINLTLGPIAKAFCGSSRPDDQKLMDRLLAKDDPTSFAERWLEAKGLTAVAKTLRPAQPRLVKADNQEAS